MRLKKRYWKNSITGLVSEYPFKPTENHYEVTKKEYMSKDNIHPIDLAKRKIKKG